MYKVSGKILKSVFFVSTLYADTTLILFCSVPCMHHVQVSVVNGSDVLKENICLGHDEKIFRRSSVSEELVLAWDSGLPHPHPALLVLVGVERCHEHCPGV